MYKASAPGTLMLLGEYAVLHDHQALVASIDKRITVDLAPRQDDIVTLYAALGTYESTIKQLEICAPFNFVLATLKKYQNQFATGFNIRISADFPPTVGFGSSAAVTVATLAALNEWLQLHLSPSEFIQIARAIIRSVQGLGSGADVAGSVLGGWVLYQSDPLLIEVLASQHPLTVLYSGYKTKTAVAVQHVNQLFNAQSGLFKALLTAIGECVNAGKEAVNNQDWVTLGKIFNIQHSIMHALGVETLELNTLIKDLRDRPGILGAKISGSGLGDCVIGLGRYPDSLVGCDSRGVECEKV